MANIFWHYGFESTGMIIVVTAFSNTNKHGNKYLVDRGPVFSYLGDLFRIDTGGCSVILAIPVFKRLHICTHQLTYNFLLP